MTVEQLRELNGMAANDSTIWTDQELIIAPAGSAAQSTTSSTPGAATDAANTKETPQPTPTIFTATLTPAPDIDTRRHPHR